MNTADIPSRPSSSCARTGSNGGRRIDGAQWKPFAEWNAEEAAIWLRGVEKLSRDVLDNFIAAGINGEALSRATHESLKEQGVTSVGQRCSILASIAAINEAEDHITANPVADLGAALLAAGQQIDKRPFASITRMVAAITATLKHLDNLLLPATANPSSPSSSSSQTASSSSHLQPTRSQGEDSAVGIGCHHGEGPSEYMRLRAEILQKCSAAVAFVLDAPPSDHTSKPFIKRNKDFVLAILPYLQQLKAELAASEAGAIQEHLHTLTLSMPIGSSPGFSLTKGYHRIATIHDIEQGGNADRIGLLCYGDEVIFVNDQNVVGWRIRSISALLKQCSNTVKVTIALPASEYDKRLQRLMQHVRALRSSFGSSSFSSARRSTTTSQASRASRSSFLNSLISGERGPRGNIEILSPARGDVYTFGCQQKVKWRTRDIPNTTSLSIRLISKKRLYSVELSAFVINSGEFTWTVPDDIAKSDDYRVVITSAFGGDEIGIISDPFTLCSNEDLSDVLATQDLLHGDQPVARAVTLYADESGSFGIDNDGQFISDVLPDGPAERAGTVAIGDQIVEINGHSVAGKSHLSIHNILRETGKQVTLLLVENERGYEEYLDKFNEIHAAYKHRLKCRQIDLPPTPDHPSFGLSLVGQNNIVSIGAVVEGTPASLCPHLAPGVAIVQANGFSAHGASVIDLLQLLKAHNIDNMKLVVTEDASVFVDYVGEILRAQDELLHTESLCMLAKQQMAMTTSLQESRGLRESMDSLSSMSSGRQSLHDVVVRRLSFQRAETPELSGSINDHPVIETPCSSLVNPDFEGWLTKQGGTGLVPKNWRRRWFVLKGSAVYYYKQPEDAVAMGCFSLRDALVMPPPPKKNMQNKFGFKVSISHGKKRSYYLCAENAADMKSWMNAMSLAAIQYKPRRKSEQDEILSTPAHMARVSQASLKNGGSGLLAPIDPHEPAPQPAPRKSSGAVLVQAGLPFSYTANSLTSSSS